MAFANKNSQYDPGLITKEAHDFYGQAVRTTDVRSVVPNFYSHFRAVYDGMDRPTDVYYYRGTEQQVTSIGCVADVAGSLNGTYFSLNSAPDNKAFHVWFNVDGTGIEPVVANSTGIEVNISQDDPAGVIATAITLTINSLYKAEFQASRTQSAVSLRTVGLGLVADTQDFGTGFVILNTPGKQELVSFLKIQYDGLDPVYQGQVLKGYSFDLYSGKFLKNPELEVNNVGIADADGDRLAINPDGTINVNVVSTGQQLFSFFYEKVGVATGVTEELLNYSVMSNMFLQKIEFSGSNIATYELVIDGVTIDRKRTYFTGDLGGVFDFGQGLNVSPGQVIQVFVFHDRPSLGDFDSRLQILQGL